MTETKYPFTKIIDGLEFTFERRGCPKTIYAHRSPSCGQPTFIGSSNMGRLRSRRIGICPHMESFDWVSWAAGDEMRRHVAWLLEDQRLERQREYIKAELAPRRGDVVYENTWGSDKGTFTVEVSGLTMEQAFQIYKMADAIRGESEPPAPIGSP